MIFISTNIKETFDKLFLDVTCFELSLYHRKDIASITYNSMLYINIIGYTKNCTVSYIADLLGVAKSAVTLKVKELEKQGFVTKSRCEHDKRIFYLHVTENVTSVMKLWDIPIDCAISEIKKNYSSEEIKLFCEMMGVISKHHITKGKVNSHE